MKRFCCQHCFTEQNIAQFIMNGGEFRQHCDYCESANVKAIEPKLIFEFVEKLDFGLKEDVVNGRLLFEILDEKFYFFDDNVLNKKMLFEAIITDNMRLNNKKYFTPDPSYIQSSWHEFSVEIKERNRFFPQTDLYRQIFTILDDESNSQSSGFNLLIESLEKSYSNDRSFYRARIDDTQLPIDEMKAPPSLTVTAGRANPVGIPYLYLADSQATCIAEVRPSNGCMVSIATFKLKDSVKILDLTDPRKRASILIQDSENLNDTLIYLDLLETFSKELSKPVLPNKSHLDYIPTQFLCEYFKTIGGFQGLAFNSSFGSGTNIVLFDQTLVEGESMQYFNVCGITHDYSEIT